MTTRMPQLPSTKFWETTEIPFPRKARWERLGWALARTGAGALSGGFIAWILFLGIGWSPFLLALPIANAVLINLTTNNAN